MRKLLVLLLCLLSCPVIAETPLPFVLLEATNQSISARYTADWMTDYGSYDVSFRTAKGIDVTVRNMSRAPQELTLRCVFFGAQVATNKRSIFSTYTKDFTLAPSHDDKRQVYSLPVSGRDTNYAMLGERYIEGTRYEGWLVQLVLKSDGRTIKQIGSRQIFEELSSKPEYAEMQRTYQAELK